MENEELNEDQDVVEETAPEPEAPPEPTWDFPTYTPPAPVSDEEPGVFDSLKTEASETALKSIGGLLQNQATLRNALSQQGASQETIMLAEATLLSMDPKVMVQPGAAQLAASLAIGQQVMSKKNWQAPQVSQPPPANSVGRENPSQTPPEVEREIEAFRNSFGDMFTDDQMKEILGV